MTAPYYADDYVTLYHGDWRDHSDGLTGDVIITDPPYGETPIPWDTWPIDWPELAHPIAPAMWCFGSFRMFHTQASQFRHWKYSQDLVWAKQTGTGMHTDRFARSHELITLWYHGDWNRLTHNVPRIPSTWPTRGHRSRPTGNRGEHIGTLGAHTWTDDGTRAMTSVITADNLLRKAIHPTQKSLHVIDPLIRYSTNPGDIVIDLFSGSGSIALAARNAGRKCIAFEIDEAYCEASATRLAQHGLDFGDWDGAA